MGLGLAAAVALGAADLAQGLRPLLSPLLTSVQSLLVAGWALILVADVRAERRRVSRSAAALALRFAAAAVVFACIVSKWLAIGWGNSIDGDPGGAYRTYGAVGTVAAALAVMARGARLGRVLVVVNARPARVVFASFGVAAVLGAIVLSLPVCQRRMGEASFVDALFIATSAVCVTGLAVHDVARTYTPGGQAVLLLLIQAGGIGIMVLSAFLALVAGQRLRVRSAAMVAEAVDAGSLAAMRRTVKGIVAATLAFETVGALVLYAALSRHGDVALGVESDAPLSGAGSVAWAAVFHSVSAFCNAGFSLFRANLVPLASDAAATLTVAALVTAGGLGFPVIAELFARVRDRARGQRPPRLSLHARTVLVVSGVLTSALAAALVALEWTRSLAGLGWTDRLLAALFQSVCARTAGFNTVALDAMAPATLAVLCAFMFVGAAPGSTGGGIKVTTLATLAATLRSLLRAEERTRLFDRALPAAVVQRAIGVTFLSASALGVVVFLLLVTEDDAPLALIFEAVSAFATVGYSTGVTAGLSTEGKLVLVAAMLAGRVGPVTLALALTGRVRPPAVREAEERVLVG
jgi:trk system potassium uptake protein TrkH